MISVLVTGGKGQLASCIRKRWIEKEGESLFFRSSSDIDLYQVDEVTEFLKDHKITHVVHTSAYTAVDNAEDESELAKKVNVDQTRSIAEACANVGVFLVHISTDFVYGGGGDTPKKIEDANPESVYGNTKLESEVVVRESGVKHLTLRTSWLYSDIGHNFYNTMNRLLGEGRDLKVVDDQRGTPTSAYYLATFIRDFIRSEDHLGLTDQTTMNFSNRGNTTWFGFASKIREVNGLPGSVTPCTSAEYPQKAKRPSYSVMDLSVLESTGWENVNWEEAVESLGAGLTKRRGG